jgi:hypothetical protein
MQIGRFFSLQQGRVGQYLSSRVLVVRMPFRQSPGDTCYFGFKRFSEAQKFAQYLAAMGHTFQLRRAQVLPQNYEISLTGNSDLARTLAYWDRVDDRRLRAVEEKSQAEPDSTHSGISGSTKPGSTNGSASTVAA